MALIDAWIEIAVKHEGGTAEFAGLEPPSLGLPGRLGQGQLEAALREIVPPEMLLRLNYGARFTFPYHIPGRVFHINVEKKNGVLSMRVAPRNRPSK